MIFDAKVDKQADPNGGELPKDRSSGNDWRYDIDRQTAPVARFRAAHSRAGVKFRYLNDSLFRGCILLLLLNGLVLKRLSDAAFLHHYFNDCLLIPCALPILLLLQRILRLREHDQAPTAAEIGGHLVLWSVLFEVAGPQLMAHAVGDWRDVICYWLGGTVAWFHWNRPVGSPTLTPSTS